MATATKLVSMMRHRARQGSPLTPELQDFIDRVIVPFLIGEHLEEEAGRQKVLARKLRAGADSAEMKCQIIFCLGAAQFQLGDAHVCMRHFRMFTTGEFGEKHNPPWAREQALDALIKQDGLDSDTASRRVNDFFDCQERGDSSARR